MFPVLYHAHNIRNLEDLAFWLDLAEKWGDPVLELGCGTGRVLLSLANAGYTVYGLDSDFAMLEFLRTQMPFHLAARVNLIQGDMSDFSLATQFPLIILPCNTYSTLSQATRTAALVRIRQHLLPGGVFAMSMPNPSLLKRLPQHAEPEIEESFTHPLDGEPVQVSSAWHKTNTQVEITWIYDHLLANGEMERTVYQVTQQIIPLKEIEEEHRNAGLIITAMYGDFDGSPFSSHSTYLILTAQKEENP